MGIPAKFSTAVTRVSVTTLLAPGVTPSQEHAALLGDKCLPHNVLSAGTLLEDGVECDARHRNDRREGAPPHRGRGLARPYAARRARPATSGLEPALDAGLAPRAWRAGAARRLGGVRTDQPLKSFSIRSTAWSQSKALVTSF